MFSERSQSPLRHRVDVDPRNRARVRLSFRVPQAAVTRGVRALFFEDTRALLERFDEL